MSKDLLLEVGTEEIPARLLAKALEDLRGLVKDRMQAAGVAPRTTRVLGTPRRLALLGEGIPETQPEKLETVLGPSRKVAFDAQGKTTRAAEGFARGQGIELADLVVEATPKGEYVAARRKTGGAPTVQLLARILPEAIEAIPFPRSMRWGTGDLRFVRPIHWIVALLGRDVVAFQLGEVKSGRESRGHRFLHPGSVKIGSPGEYLEAMEGHGVIADPADRRARIESEIHAWASTVDGLPIQDPALLDHVTSLVELPTSVRGEFDSAYLALPRDVLITAMREHQKVFSIEHPSGRLLPYFVSVLNISPKHREGVVRGNERVLRARLADARFFFEEDRKVRLEDRVEGLDKVRFQAKLGSIRDKVDRIGRLVETCGRLAAAAAKGTPAEEAILGALGHATRAARLCKADLVTHVVREFPDLQGIMGREYARLDGEPEEVAVAIEEHYRPRQSGGALPETPAGALLAIAEKLDTLAGCFHAGLLPTATQDPYGLRRAALGIIAILERFEDWRLPMDAAVARALGLQGDVETSGTRQLLLEFLKGRLTNYLLSSGYAHDVVEAVISARLDKKRLEYMPGREDRFSWDVSGIIARVRMLAEAKGGDGFIPLATTFRRVVNIIPEGAEISTPHATAEREPAEADLAEAYVAASEAAGPLIRERRYEELFGVLRTLKPKVDRFFDEVRVIDPARPDCQKQRLWLLTAIANLFYEIADFSKIVIEMETRT